jgi:hypothetical protein
VAAGEEEVVVVVAGLERGGEGRGESLIYVRRPTYASIKGEQPGSRSEKLRLTYGWLDEFPKPLEAPTYCESLVKSFGYERRESRKRRPAIISYSL